MGDFVDPVKGLSCFEAKSNDGRSVRVTLWSDQTFSIRFRRPYCTATIDTHIRIPMGAAQGLASCFRDCVGEAAAKELVEKSKKARKHVRKAK